MAKKKEAQIPEEIDAELKSPDLGTGIPQLSKMFQIDGERDYIYGYIKDGSSKKAPDC